MLYSVKFRPVTLGSALVVGLSLPAYADTSDEQMVVTATRTGNSVAQAPASVSVITADEIDAMPALTLNDIVAQAVGVESTKQGGRAGRELINIRGMSSAYTLILLNGRRMSSSNAIIRGNDFDYSSIPANSIERVEIIRGPMSSLYGSDALGGVINIITKTSDNTWQTSTRADFQSPEENGGEQYALGLNTGGALIDDRLLMNFSLSYSDRNAWMPFADNGDVDWDRREVTALENKEYVNALNRFTWLIDDRQQVDVDLAYSRDQRDSVIESTSGLTPSKMDTRRLSAALSHQGYWDWADTQARYGMERVDLEEGVDDVFEVTEDNHIVDMSASTELANHRVTFGGEWRYSKLNSERDLLDTGRATSQQQAAFVQDEWALADDWTLTLGGRLDHHDEFGSHVSPRAYLVNQVTQDLVIKGGVGQAFKAPSMLQLNPEYRLSSCKGDCYIVGNPDLEPEESTNMELAAVYQVGTWHTEATVFRNEIKNLIERDRDNVVGEQDGRDVYTYQNTEKARIDGIELAANGALTDALSLRATYSYIDAVDRTTGDTLEERPDHNMLVRVNWDMNYSLRSFVQFNHVGQQVLDGDLEQGSYNTVDLGLNYYWQDDVRLRFGVNNIGDTQFSEQASIRGYNADPRTWYAGISSDF